MTARQFLEWAGVEFNEHNLWLLGDYVGKWGGYFAQFPDMTVYTEDGTYLEECDGEPANFQEYVDERQEDNF